MSTTLSSTWGDSLSRESVSRPQVALRPRREGQRSRNKLMDGGNMMEMGKREEGVQ